MRESTGQSGCGSPTRIILARGSRRNSLRNARRDSGMRLYGFRYPKMPMSGVVSSIPSRSRQAPRSGSATQAPCGMRATGPP